MAPFLILRVLFLSPSADAVFGARQNDLISRMIFLPKRLESDTEKASLRNGAARRKKINKNENLIHHSFLFVF